MQACREGHFECVKLLLQNGADPSICNLLGVNALTIATRGGYEKIVNLLFEHDVYLSKGLCQDQIGSPYFNESNVINGIFAHKIKHMATDDMV